jgi:hypothetical protein
MSEIPTNPYEFERQFATLTEHAAAGVENPGSYKSTDCERCFDCMFTTSSTGCYQCTYCSDCTACTNCTHCKGCSDCHSSTYCVRSRLLAGCSYVLMSRECYDCVFCFGCVGLVKKEFHILNQPFRRDEYFRIVKDLKAAFGL